MLQRDLRTVIYERLDALRNVDQRRAGSAVMIAADWINSQPILRAALDEADAAEPGLDFDDFDKKLQNKGFTWGSSSEAACALLAWRVMQKIADRARSGNPDPFNPYRWSGGDTIAQSWLMFGREIFPPLFRYLAEAVDAQRSVLALLRRYVQRVEWYDRKDLYARYEQAREDNHQAEEVYNLDLQRFLFVDAGYTTSAKVRSASGEPDLVGELESQDPLVCEGKLFKGDKGYLAAGVHQVYSAAVDYAKTSAYLVIWNVTERPLDFSVETAAGLPFIDLAGIRVFLVRVRVRPPAKTASKLGIAQPYLITQEDLVNLPDE